MLCGCDASASMPELSKRCVPTYLSCSSAVPLSRQVYLDLSPWDIWSSPSTNLSNCDHLLSICFCQCSLNTDARYEQNLVRLQVRGWAYVTVGEKRGAVSVVWRAEGYRPPFATLWPPRYYWRRQCSPSGWTGSSSGTTPSSLIKRSGHALKEACRPTRGTDLQGLLVLVGGLTFQQPSDTQRRLGCGSAHTDSRSVGAGK